MNNRSSFITIVFILVFATSAYSAVGERMGLTALSSMQRIGQDQKPYGANKVEIKSAKNEVESFQVVVAALKENIRVVKAEISDLVGTDGSKIGRDSIKLYRAEYVRVRRSTPRAELPPGLYTDPLVPFINPLTSKPIEPLTRFRKRWGEPVITRGYDMYAVPFELLRDKTSLYG